MGTLRLSGDSLLAYHGESERSGPYRFYPGILVSAWASFEAFVRIYSELFVKSANELPTPAAEALLGKTQVVDDQGKIANTIGAAESGNLGRRQSKGTE